MANQYKRAHRVWNILVACAERGEIISFGSLGARVGIDHRAVGFVLNLIQDYCSAQGLPPLTVLCVYQSTLRPSEKRIHWDPTDIHGAQAGVFRFPWAGLDNPFRFAKDGWGCADVVRDLKEAPHSADAVYAKIGDSGMAAHLYGILLGDVYGNRCAFTGIRFPACLEAAYILPPSAGCPGQRMDVRNGILLSAIHRRLFDAGLMSIDSDYRIRFYDPEARRRVYTAVERRLSADLHGRRMFVPFQRRHRPRPEWIRKRNRMMDWVES